MTQPLIFAHRGWSSRAPENSLEAFALAAAGDADGMELDIHETADGGFVVHHDEDLGDGRLILDLPQFAVVGRTSDTGASVPLLSEVLSLLAEQMAGGEVFVEVKGMRSWQGLRSVLRPYTDSLRIEVQSFVPETLALMASQPDGHTLGWITETPGPDPLATLCSYNAKTLSLHHDAVTAELCEELHNVGLRLAAWTVNDPERAMELARLGVDVLIGDDPGMLRRILYPSVDSDAHPVQR